MVAPAHSGSKSTKIGIYINNVRIKIVCSIKINYSYVKMSADRRPPSLAQNSASVRKLPFFLKYKIFLYKSLYNRQGKCKQFPNIFIFHVKRSAEMVGANRIQHRFNQMPKNCQFYPKYSIFLLKSPQNRLVQSNQRRLCPPANQFFVSFVTFFCYMLKLGPRKYTFF